MVRKKEELVKDVHRAGPKKLWVMPKLTRYGHVAELTAGTSGSHMDKGHEANEHGVG